MKITFLALVSLLAATAALAQDIAEAQSKMKETMAANAEKRKAQAERLAAIQWTTSEAEWAVPPAKPTSRPANPCAKPTDAEDREMGLLPSECAGKTRGTLDNKDLGFVWVGDKERKFIWVSKLNGNFLLKPELMVSSIYPEGGCAYNATYAHELLHWDDYRQIYHIVLQNTTKLIVEGIEFPTATYPHKFAPGETPESYMAGFDQALHDIIKEWRERLKYAAGKATVKRDTDEVEAKKRESCGKEWNGRVL